MLQERAQCVELQGREEPPGHYRGTLTIGGSDCMQAEPNYEASLQSSIDIFWKTQEEFSFIMAAQTVKKIGSDSRG